MSDVPIDSQAPETQQSHASEVPNGQSQSDPPPPRSPSILSERPTPEPAVLQPSVTLQPDSKANQDSDPDETIAVHQTSSQNVPTSDTAGQNVPSQHTDQHSAATASAAPVLPDVTPGAERRDLLPSSQPLTPIAPKHRGGTRGGNRQGSVNGTPRGTPNSSSSRGRRGRPGRPRGRGRGGGAAGRGSERKRKRKRNADDDDNDDDDAASDFSTSSEEFVAVSMTKSGRAVQKPTSFVPPQATSTPQAHATPLTGGPQTFASPSRSGALNSASTPATATAAGGGTTAANRPLKKKRMYRRNPDAAVCKVCLRGTSPSKNMIVFCDGCNQAYHRYCHVPVIDQQVIDEVDKEWFCSPCEKERAEVVSEDAVAGFVSASDASYEEKQAYFSSLPPGMLVTLLMRATTQRPDLPLFPPDFVTESTSASASAGAEAGASQPSSTQAHPHSASKTNGDSTGATMTPSQNAPNGHPHPQGQDQDQKHYSADRPVKKLKFFASSTAGGARDEPVPDEHPPTYPRPGYGLQQTLPSEHENSERLVDDGHQYGVFTHLYQVDQNAAPEGMGGEGQDGRGNGGGIGSGSGDAAVTG